MGRYNSNAETAPAYLFVAYRCVLGLPAVAYWLRTAGAFCSKSLIMGRRDWTRTNDPYHVELVAVISGKQGARSLPRRESRRISLPLRIASTRKPSYLSSNVES